MIPKTLSLLGTIVASVVCLLFLIDLATSFFMEKSFPFANASMTMDIGFIVCSAIVIYMGYSTYKEQAT